MLTINFLGYRAQICRNTQTPIRFLRIARIPVSQRLIWAGPIFILIQHPTTPKD